MIVFFFVCARVLTEVHRISDNYVYYQMTTAYLALDVCLNEDLAKQTHIWRVWFLP